MLHHIASNLFKTREGFIAVVAGLFYVAAGLVAKYAPGAIPLSGFYAWLCLFMPLPLVLMFHQIGGFKKSFQSSWFNTTMIVVTALVPIFVGLKARFF